MADSNVRSREARLDFDEDTLEGEKAKTPNNLTRKEIFDISFVSVIMLSSRSFCCLPSVKKE